MEGIVKRIWAGGYIHRMFSIHFPIHKKVSDDYEMYRTEKAKYYWNWQRGSIEDVFFNGSYFEGKTKKNTQLENLCGSLSRL